MRKYVVWAFCFAMIITLLSCGGADNKNNLDISYSLEPSSDIPAVSNTNADIAMEIYEAVLKNEIKVFETDIEEYNYLKDCKTPYNRIPLCEMEGLGYNYMDVDGDSICEIVIDCFDTLILRYYDGEVYVYPFAFKNMYQLNTDGSYNWNYNGQSFEYGENKIAFDGAKLVNKNLWRIVNDEEPNAEYYIGEKQVTKEELLNYVENNPKTKVDFLPLEVLWQKKLTEEDALQIASEYWGIEDGFTDYGAGSMWICRIMILDPPSSAWGYYHIGLQTDHYGRDENDLRVHIESRMEHIFVDSVTGECQDYAPIYISRSEAITLAEKYWEHFDIEKNGYFVQIGTNKHAPSSVYVLLIRRLVIDHYSTFDEIWIDRTTGEVIIPFTPDDKG